MKNKLLIGGVLAAIASGAIFSTATLAADGSDSYVNVNKGQLLKDSSGNCVRTGTWKKEDMTVECGAKPVVEAKAPPPPPPPPPPAEPVYEKTTLSSEALFDHDKSNLKPEGKKAIGAVAEKIRSMGASVVDIEIIGHTDSQGSEEYNQKLSVRRATAVRDYIVNNYPKVDASIIRITGMGETSPVADNKTKEGRAQNRRVEVNVGVKVPQ